MAQLKWIKVHLFLFLGLQFTVCTISEPTVFIRSGDDVVWSCPHVIRGQINCNGTTWVHSNTNGLDHQLVKVGQVKKYQSKSDRLSVTANCSLVMRNIAVKDAGYYQCQQYRSEAEPSKYILVHQAGFYLSVVHMTEQVRDVVTLTCSVETRGQCGYRVKWLTDCPPGETALTNCTTQRSDCSAAVCFIEQSYTQRCEFKCEVTNGETKQIFNFSHQSTEDKSGKTTCNPTRKAEDATSVLPVRNSLSNEGIKIIVLSVGLVALSGTVLVVHIWIRIKGNKTWTVKNKSGDDEEDEL